MRTIKYFTNKECACEHTITYFYKKTYDCVIIDLKLFTKFLSDVKGNYDCYLCGKYKKCSMWDYNFTDEIVAEYSEYLELIKNIKI